MYIYKYGLNTRSFEDQLNETQVVSFIQLYFYLIL